MAIENFNNNIKTNDILVQKKDHNEMKDVMEKNDDDFVDSLPVSTESAVNYYKKAEKAPNDVLFEKTEDTGFSDLF